MNDQPNDRDLMPAEIDFSKATRGLPISLRAQRCLFLHRLQWGIFAGKAVLAATVELSALLTEVLSRDIEIDEALK